MRLVAQHLCEAWKIPRHRREPRRRGRRDRLAVGRRPGARRTHVPRRGERVRRARGDRPQRALRRGEGFHRRRADGALAELPRRLARARLQDAAATSSPGRSSSRRAIQYASAGVGSTAHLHAAAVAHLAGFKAEHIPYRGTPEAVNDAMNGRVLYAFAPGPNAIPLAKAASCRSSPPPRPPARASTPACRRSPRPASTTKATTGSASSPRRRRRSSCARSSPRRSSASSPFPT